ncbi:MAG TPA: glycosyltransferase [Gaiellaceae bacterium]|nr:glycosyltransferase [Gaiellaceae bacterium]
MRTENARPLGDAPLTDSAAGGAAVSTRPAIGLVSPLPPQVGGVASFAEWLLEHEAEIGCRFVTFDLERPPAGPAGGRLAAGEVLRQARLAVRFVRWARRAPRIVHLCVSYTTTGLVRDLAYAALLRAAGRRVVAHVHGGSLVAGDASARATLVRAVARLAAETVTIGPSSAAALGSLGVRTEWVMNPVRIEPAGERRSGATLRVLFAGTYGERKGTPDLLRAVARAQEDGAAVELVLAGKEEHLGEEAVLRSLAAELRLNGSVRFAGLVGRERLAELYGEADAFCLPSERDGVPMALLEAMAAGLPVVATRVGGIGDLVVDGETGLLVGPGDSVAVAEALASLARSQKLRRRLGEAGRARVRELAAPAALVVRWRQIYERHGPGLEPAA